MNQMTLGSFLCESLTQVGILQVFGLAGDDNFTILDEFENHWQPS